jgi:hypothetical protein
VRKHLLASASCDNGVHPFDGWIRIQYHLTEHLGAIDPIPRSRAHGPITEAGRPVKDEIDMATVGWTSSAIKMPMLRPLVLLRSQKVQGDSIDMPTADQCYVHWPADAGIGGYSSWNLLVA